MIHYRTTGPEIWQGVGGERRYPGVRGWVPAAPYPGPAGILRSRTRRSGVVAVEPTESPVLAGGAMGPHMIQGIGAGFIPGNYHGDVVDEVIQVSSEESIETAQALGRAEGFLVGISSGAAVAAVRKLAADPANEGRRMVVILPDIGERYISTLLFYRGLSFISCNEN